MKKGILLLHSFGSTDNGKQSLDKNPGLNAIWLQTKSNPKSERIEFFTVAIVCNGYG